MTGAAHLVATNHVYNVAKPDGLTLLAANPNVGIAQLTKVEAARFDLRRFQWLGSTGADGVALSIRSRPALQELGRAEEVRQGAGRRHHRAGIQRARLPAAAEGVRRREFQAGVGLSGQRRRPARHRAQGSRRLGGVRHHHQARRRPRRGAAAGARTRGASRAGSTCRSTRSSPPARSARRSWASAPRRSRSDAPFAAPPATPADRVQILREAFAKAVKDPEFIAEIEEGEHRGRLHRARTRC